VQQEAFEDRYFDPTDLWNGEYSDLLRSAAPPYHAGEHTTAHLQHIRAQHLHLTPEMSRND